MSHCLLTGGSSQIGYFLLPRLLHDDADVQLLALARQSMPDHLASHQRLRWLVADHAGSRMPAATAVTEIISLGPLQLTLEQLARHPALQRVVAISSSSVLIKLHSANLGERAQIRALATAEQALIEQCRQRGIVCQVLRPTLIYGAGLDANVCALAQLAQRYGVIPVAGRAGGLRQPVHAADLATAILRLRRHDHSGIWSVAGGSTLSYRQIATTVCQTLQRGHVIGVPPTLLRTVLAMAHLGGRLGQVNAAMIERQNQDLLFDQQPAMTEWGWSPRPFQLTAAMLHAPQQPFRHHPE